MNQRKFKILTSDMKPPFRGGFTYELGRKYECKGFDMSDESCSNGYYATDIDGLIYTDLSDGKRVFEAIVSGKQKVFGPYKQRFEKMEIVKEIESEELKVLVKEQSDKMFWNYYEALFPFNPFSIDNKISIGSAKKYLEKIDSVGASVWASVRDSVWAYQGSFFPDIKAWKYIDHKQSGYPFQPYVDLWYGGLVPCYYDGEVHLFSRDGLFI